MPLGRTKSSPASERDLHLHGPRGSPGTPPPAGHPQVTAEQGGSREGARRRPQNWALEGEAAAGGNRLGRMGRARPAIPGPEAHSLLSPSSARRERGVMCGGGRQGSRSHVPGEARTRCGAPRGRSEQSSARVRPRGSQEPAGGIPVSSTRRRSQENPREMLHSHVGLSAGPRGCRRKDRGRDPAAWGLPASACCITVASGCRGGPGFEQPPAPEAPREPGWHANADAER